MTNSLIENDGAARERALDPQQSFIVQAPAGSGKTELLIQRFLTLLCHVSKPEEILAITFTKKAANEMRVRLLKALIDARDLPSPHSHHHKKTWSIAKMVLKRNEELNWNLIDNPNQIRIQTIDSLCHYLTAQLPLLSKFGSTPAVLPDATPLYFAASQKVLNHLEDKGEFATSIAKLLLHLDNDLNKVQFFIMNLLAKREQWLPYIQFDTEKTKRYLESHLKLIIESNLKKLANLFPHNCKQELVTIGKFAAANLTQLSIENEITLLKSLTEFPSATVNNLLIWKGLATLLLTKNLSWRKKVDKNLGFLPLDACLSTADKQYQQEFKQRYMELIASLNTNEELRTVFSELFFLPQPVYNSQQWDVLQAMLVVLKVAAAELRLVFESHNQIDFNENSLAALLALGSDENPTDLGLILDYQLKHLLIDEFQDTSLLHYQLIEKLVMGWQPNDGKTLFIVGDPMQSIYLFREAEVGLFLSLAKKGIAQIQLTPLKLSVNFRSSSDIVEWINIQFKRLFPKYNDIATGAISYSPSISTKVSTTHHGVKIEGFEDEDQTPNAIVKEILAIQQNNSKESIAILVRSRNHLKTILPLLKKAKLNYRAVAIDSLAAKQIIQDLLALTCALIHPADRTAWLSVLRAPWCGLTLSDLLLLTQGQQTTPLLKLINDTNFCMRISLDGQQRLRKIAPILNQSVADKYRINLRTWIENTWLLLGGPACLTHEDDLDNADCFFSLLEEFNNQSIDVQNLKDRTEQLYASSGKAQHPLQLMTIHAAKGLEFDHVILPMLEKKVPSANKDLISWMEYPLPENKTTILLAPIHEIGNKKDSLYEYITRLRKTKINYEIPRLLYVAATRARKKLSIFFNISAEQQEHFSFDANSFLSLLWPCIKNDKASIIFPSVNKTNLTENILTDKKMLKRLPSTWNNCLQAHPKPLLHSHQNDNSGFKLIENRQAIIGIVNHRIFHMLSINGIHWWSSKNKQMQQEYLLYHLKQEGMVNNLENAAALLYKNIYNMLEDTRGKWILNNHKDAYSEYAITTVINGKLETLIIDRTFIDANNDRWIIDYKTALLNHQELNRFLEEQQKKYLEKMQHYAAAIRCMETRPIKLGLYFPALPAWKEWDL